MLRYNVRSRQLVDVVRELRSGRLILTPYFQRNLVWRFKHKHDFVETILLGYPIPQIFLAKGGIGDQELDELVDLKRDPNISEEFFNWAKNKSENKFQSLLLDHGIFSAYEISRKVHLQFTLNALAASVSGLFNRNEKAKELLEKFNDKFPDRDVVFSNLESAAEFIVRMRLSEKSLWLKKASAFSLLLVLSRNAGQLKGMKPAEVKAELEAAAENLPENYRLAAREAVNNKRERGLRDAYISHKLFGTLFEEGHDF
jgi:hypothetical protein